MSRSQIRTGQLSAGQLERVKIVADLDVDARKIISMKRTPQLKRVRDGKPHHVFKSGQCMPDHFNWLGIVPTGDLMFTADEILGGEVQCALFPDRVVYLLREVGTSAESVQRRLKVTTWVNGKLMHRGLFCTIAEAQADYKLEERKAAIALAIEVIG